MNLRWSLTPILNVITTPLIGGPQDSRFLIGDLHEAIAKSPKRSLFVYSLISIGPLIYVLPRERTLSVN